MNCQNLLFVQSDEGLAMLLILMAYLSADPIPDEVRRYFDRQEAVVAEQITKLEQQIADLQIAIKGEPLARRKSVLTATLHKTEDVLEARKKSKERAPAELPREMKVGDIGTLPKSLRFTVHAVIDDHTAVIKDHIVGSVILEMDTKGLKARQAFQSFELWQVTSIKTADKELRRYMPNEGMLGFYAVKPVKLKDVEKHRAVYAAGRIQTP